jgi:hypothetical protein
MADNEAPDPQKIMRLARQAMSSAEYRKKFHLADFWGQQRWYGPQLRFFTAGTKHHQRLIRGGNQTGKSEAAAYEAGLHMTGQYPRWWTGRRFTKPTRGWIVGPERTLVRDGPQKKLTAMQGEFGTGTIPLATFAGKPIMVPGGTGSIDTMSVAHETDAPATASARPHSRASSRARRKCRPNPSTGFGLTSAAARKSTAS